MCYATLNSEGLQGNAYAQKVLAQINKNMNCVTAHRHYPEVLSELANYVIDIEGKSSCCSINFVSKEEIQELNKKYRNIDAPTDVLSFESDIENDLGDIFICLEIAEENAQKFDSSLDSELKLLTVHGMLHLCGYDHMLDEEAKVMEAREEQILDAWEKRQL